MKNIADVNDKVMDLNKKHKDINKEDTPLPVESKTTNNMFIGSTADLQKMLQQANKPTELKDNVIDITPRLNDDEQH
jgi:hypothetical protein